MSLPPPCALAACWRGAELLPKPLELSWSLPVRGSHCGKGLRCPSSHSGSSAAAGTRRLSPQELLRTHGEPFLLAKRELPTLSAWMEQAATRLHQPPVPPHRLLFSLHLQDRGCDFPLTPATAVTRNCRAARKLQIQRDKDYFPQKRGKNCCICKDFPGPVPSCAHLSGVTPSFKHPSFHSHSRNYLH